jgi:pentapeptide MXKDX repeat protein
MKHLPSLLLAGFALILLGQGCPTPQPQTPPHDDAIQQKDVMEKDVMEKDTMEKKDAMQKNDAMQKDTMMPKNDGAVEKTEGMMEQKSASTYEPFTKAKYETTRAANKPVLLFFYAN